MAENKRRPRNTFRKFERMMTRVILGTLAVFVLMLAASAGGIGWVKWMLAITVVLVSHRKSTMGIADQVYSVEHGRMC